MEVKWIKTKHEITDEKLADMGLDRSRVKIRKGKSHHEKAKKMLKDRLKDRNDRYE